jgi:deazaflavin-dependent oxidoreductase (nitroreductase family)
MPNIRWLLALITACHRGLYRWSGGRLGDRVGRKRFLLLVHRGRRSGARYTAPLLYVADGDRFVVVASNAGDGRDPQWWRNLQQTPETEIQVGERRIAVRARAASAEERESIWPRLLASYQHYAVYRERAGREIPLVILERRAA